MKELRENVPVKQELEWMCVFVFLYADYVGRDLINSKQITVKLRLQVAADNVGDCWLGVVIDDVVVVMVM